ncbi:hypothetical protein ACFQRK_23525 [Parapedobacter sp. GCM10030251]|uniref:hypothetical protein n=1 Tax=Parapedobacter sp. GCM10030251 TaxID=3273419 RepID=UPI003608486B
METRGTKVMRITAAGVFVFAFMLNIHTNFSGETSLIGQQLIGQTSGTGTGTGTGSGTEPKKWVLEDSDCETVCCIAGSGMEIRYEYGSVKGCFEGNDDICSPEGSCSALYAAKERQIEEYCEQLCP